MARGRKKKSGPDVKQKMRGAYLVWMKDEKKQDVYFPGVDWKYLEELYAIPKVIITKIETIDTKHHRPEDITEKTLKKLAGGKNG